MAPKDAAALHSQGQLVPFAHRMKVTLFSLFSAKRNQGPRRNRRLSSSAQ